MTNSERPVAGKGIGRWAAPMLVVICGLVAYCNSLHGPFIFDDIDAIPGNEQVRTLVPHFGAARTSTTLGGRPVATFTFSVDYALARFRVEIYHQTNLLIHLCCGLLLYGIVRRNLGNGDFWGDRFAGSSRWLGAAVGMLWVVHPLNTESVTYIVQRTEALASLFYLWVIYCLIRRSEGGGFGWELAGILGCALGMGSKEMMVTAPVMALLYDRTFLAGSFKDAVKKRGSLYAGLACTWIVLGLLMATNGRGKSVGFEQGIAVRDYARTQLGVIAHYLRLAVWPRGLVLDEYGWPIVHGWSEITWGWGVVGLGVGTLLALWKKSWLGFMGMWLFVILSPSSSLVPIVTEIAAEHRMYLPLAGVVALVVVGGWEIFRRLQVGWLAIGAGGFVLAVMGSMTLNRNSDYATAVGIWRQTLALRPDNPRAHFNLGYSLMQNEEKWAAGSPEAVAGAKEAVGEFQTALKLEPNYHAARSKLGKALMEAGELVAAERWYTYLLTVEPMGVGEIRFMRGSARAQLGEWSGAREDFEASVAIHPEDPQTHYLLGMVLSQMKQWKDAEAQFARTMELSPGYKDAVLKLREMRTMQGLPMD